MEKVVFINFGSVQYLHRQMLQLLSAKYAGKATYVRGYQCGDLKRLGFYTSRPWAAPLQRGVFFWSWKPFIINHALQLLQDGDILIYSDIGRPWVRLFSSLLPFARNWLDELQQDVIPGVYIPYTGTIENWTKATTLKQMGNLSTNILHSPPIQASFSIWRKTSVSMELAAEWNDKSRHISLIGDYNTQTDIPNHPEFIDHRHDQSILSILCYQRGLHALDLPAKPFLQNDKDLNEWFQYKGAPRSKKLPLTIISLLSEGTHQLEKILRSCSKSTILG